MRKNDATWQFSRQGLLTLLVLLGQCDDMSNHLRKVARVLTAHGDYAAHDGVFIARRQVGATDSDTREEQAWIRTIWPDLGQLILSQRDHHPFRLDDRYHGIHGGTIFREIRGGGDDMCRLIHVNSRKYNSAIPLDSDL